MTVRDPYHADNLTIDAGLIGYRLALWPARYWLRLLARAVAVAIRSRQEH